MSAWTEDLDEHLNQSTETQSHKTEEFRCEACLCVKQHEFKQLFFFLITWLYSIAIYDDSSTFSFQDSISDCGMKIS